MQPRSGLVALVAFFFAVPGQRTFATNQSADFSYADYATVLSRFIDAAGMVDYKKLKAAPDKLNAFVDVMDGLDPNSFGSWSENDKLAFWLNAYNGLTLKAIIGNYPIDPSGFKSFYYPSNSIRQIPGVWDKLKFNIMGADYTLEHIEHQILRVEFDEPRIHMAMVCAAMGCPQLRNEPYLAEKLSEQLDDQTRRFLADPTKFSIDRDAHVVHLSSIFKWFGDDFVGKYGPQKNIGRHNNKTSAVLNFIAGYLEQAETEYILKGNFKVYYLKYDWSLNEQN